MLLCGEANDESVASRDESAEPAECLNRRASASMYSPRMVAFDAVDVELGVFNSPLFVETAVSLVEFRTQGGAPVGRLPWANLGPPPRG